MNDIRMLDLNLLRALDALLDERSVTRAASRLSLTQPAVSGALARLRETFDDPLFVRAQHGMLPTPRAVDLASPVKRLLADAEALIRPRAFDPARAELLVSVSATDYGQRTLVRPFLTSLRERAPRMRVAVWPCEGARARDQLERGEIDLAFTLPEEAPEPFYSRRLYDEGYVCALRADHPAAIAGGMTLDRFCTLDHVMVSPKGGGFRGATDAALETVGRSRRVALSVSSFLVLPDILRASDLVAVVPGRLFSGEPGIALLTPPLDIPGFTMIAAWHERTQHDLVHQWVRSLLHTTAAGSV